MAYRILIVDDEPALQQLVGEILSGAGYETDSALLFPAGKNAGGPGSAGAVPFRPG